MFVEMMMDPNFRKCMCGKIGEVGKEKNKFSSFITLTGFIKNNPQKKLANINLWVDSNCYNYIENIHQILLLSIVDSLKV